PVCLNHPFLGRIATGHWTAVHWQWSANHLPCLRLKLQHTATRPRGDMELSWSAQQLMASNHDRNSAIVSAIESSNGCRQSGYSPISFHTRKITGYLVDLIIETRPIANVISPSGVF